MNRLVFLAPAAALILVAAVWMALPLSESGSQGPADPSQASVPDAVPGFRSDLWFLPDEALLGFVEVPAGPFIMGSRPSLDPLAYDNEVWPGREPQQTVQEPAFFIARYEVTVAQFAAFVSETGYAVSDGALQAPPDHPVSGVSWTDALAYARWLEGSLKESSSVPDGLATLLREGWTVTLPTESQWEKAARGTNGRIFPWGDSPDPERANYQSTGTRRVGSFDCSTCAYGLADMSGNVWEFTRSPFAEYPYDRTSLGDLEAAPLWVMRGGSFTDPDRNVRTATRGGVAPGSRRPFIGFRLVLTRPSF